jgi:hypothetical protein
VAAGHKQTERALAFLIEWRPRARADRLVRERLAALDGRFYQVLRPAAEALEEKFPTQRACSTVARWRACWIAARRSNTLGARDFYPAHVSRRVC